MVPAPQFASSRFPGGSLAWFPGCRLGCLGRARSGRNFGLQEMAQLEEKLEKALAMAVGASVANAGYAYGFNGQHLQGNWEFQKVLESEKPRLRGVLEALGPAGWYGFVAWTLQKLCFVDLFCVFCGKCCFILVN